MTISNILSMCAALAVTTGGLFAMAPPASAKERPVVVLAPTDLPTRRVSYADLNLATSAGESTLNRRVARAVTSVCEESVGPSANYFGEVACRKFAWGGAKPQMALAVQRAHDIAATGTSLIAVQAITLAVPR